MSLPKAVEIARVNLVRLLRDRFGLFFIFVFPLLLVLVLGLTFGGGFEPRVGIIGAGSGAGLAEELADALAGEAAGWRIEHRTDEADMTDDVRSGSLLAGIVLPPDYDDRLRAGSEVGVAFVVADADRAALLRSSLDAAIADQVAVARAAAVTSEQTGLDPAEAFAAVDEASGSLEPIGVEVTTIGEQPFPEALLGFGLGAQNQLVLFMFVTSMSGAAQLILSRTLGVSRRMLSTPTTISTILVGEALGRLAVALLQGVFIVLATAIGFGVDWGDVLGAAAIVLAFAAVGAAAAMLVGAVATNAEQATGIGIFAGLGIAALGGAMAPPEIFPPIMDTVSRLTPHRWAIDGLRELAAGGGLLDTLPQLGVLFAFAVVLGTLATWRLRVALTR
jgi:ABC-2 type transport system permease protein